MIKLKINLSVMQWPFKIPGNMKSKISALTFYKDITQNYL